MTKFSNYKSIFIDRAHIETIRKELKASLRSLGIRYAHDQSDLTPEAKEALNNRIAAITAVLEELGE